MFKVMPSAGNVMFTVFWDSQGALLAHFQKCGENVNSASYCEVLTQLQDAVHRKIHANWQEGCCFVITKQAIQERIQELQWGAS
jgi:hypothetical protein